ncbi:hypothetical protein [Gordonia insulae]|uniref:YrhK domain-containing protein n=1 Tax=Gordonia insulae TaxID=2420509 RepID=A0A3G8JV41_9ACTN|nr:hypothetical protein [Gordonia insulae]AZG48625.1 hypothetical protein D7316_05243 [Gordonia insulae]
MSIADTGSSGLARVLTPTLRKQCWGFMIGSALFALGSAPGFGQWAGASASNLAYFVGAWFFTAAGLIQLLMSGARTVPVAYGTGTMVRAEWLTAASQSLGTVLFNVSTTAAIAAHSVPAERHLVWSPDAGGSIAFLVSGAVAYVAYYRANGTNWAPRDSGWWSVQINWVGCVAFAVSAVGAYVTRTGVTVDTVVANVGTFIGALCFFFASLVVLPRRSSAGVGAGS